VKINTISVVEIRLTGWIRVVVALVVLAVVGFVGWRAYESFNDAEEAISTGGALGDPAGKDSLLRSENLGDAVAAAKKELGDGGTITIIKVDPGQLTVTGKKGDGKGTVLTISDDAKVKNRLPAPPIDAGGTFTADQVDPAAADKMVAAIEKQSGKKLEDLTYMALAVDPTNGKPFWTVFTKGSSLAFMANLDGSGVHKLGTAPPGQGAPKGGKKGGKKGGAATTPADRAKAIADCIKKAGNDPAKLAACQP
jgi:hypothetical protein